MSRYYLDEIQAHVDPVWTAEELLAQKGVFPLTSVTGCLGLSLRKVRDLALALADEGAGDVMYQEYGLLKIKGRWWVRMLVFKDVYIGFKDECAPPQSKEARKNPSEGPIREAELGLPVWKKWLKALANRLARINRK